MTRKPPNEGAGFRQGSGGDFYHVQRLVINIGLVFSAFLKPQDS